MVYNGYMAKSKTARTNKIAKKISGVKKSKGTSEKSSASKKKTTSKKSSQGMSLYSNLAYRHRVKEDERARKKAEELAKLPKHPVARFFARLRPDRLFKAIFSREGFFFFLKFCAAVFLIGIISVGGLFLYYKKDLAAINPEELAKRVTNTVNTYLDRNGELLWEDKGSGDYRLVVDGSEISSYMRQATVAIEDKNFYNHIGIDPKGIIRAAYVTLTGGAVQGGSTLTQQLIKQVYFSDEAGDRTVTGIPRKIKEMILAIEIEKMYSKEDIITLYLNESPYGGRRNGVESAAQTYFNKSAKDLNLAESALLAAIPNNPGVLNPYNTYGHKALIARQHKVLDSMVEMGYISQDDCDSAKEIDILEQVHPESEQYQNIKAPWFVLEVKAQLEAKYGIKTMRAGGFTIKTSLDLRAQQLAENALKEGQSVFYANGSDNASLVSVDVETAQVIAMAGSVDWNIPGYGQVNATTSLLEPASTIKPILDYAPLFMERSGTNYGPGTIWPDVNIDSIYCKGTYGSCKLRNASGRFYGNVTIRQSLAGSLNIGAVKALYVNGIDKSLEVVRGLGDKSYCANGEQAGLSMAIGGGCAVRPVEHANAYASLARGGVYKDLVYWLEVKNSSGEVIDSWSDNEGTRVISDQVAYMVTDILADADARRFTFGSNLAYAPGFYSRKTWFAAKTGTTDIGGIKAKDSWVMTYSPVLATAIWNGNHDGRALSNGSHTVAFKISAAYIDAVHEQVYAEDGRWHSGMKIEKPSGIKTMSVNGKTDIWPSWFGNNKSDIETEKKVFDSVSKKLATDCTPEETRIEVNVSKIIDPVLNKVEYYADGYDASAEDDVHQCSDKKPTASLSTSEDDSTGTTMYTITGTANFGTYSLKSYTLTVNGTVVKSGSLEGTSDAIEYQTDVKPTSIVFTVEDTAGYKTSATMN